MGAYDGSADDIRSATFSPDTLADIIEGIKLSSGYTTTGSSSAYVITPSPACDSFENGQVFMAILNHTNTGACTMRWDGATDKTMTDRLDNAFTGGELTSGSIHIFYYDGTNVRCLTAIALQTYTPTWSAAGGTFTSITTDKAEFKDHGDYVWFHAQARGTTASDCTYLAVTIPSTSDTSNSDLYPLSACRYDPGGFPDPAFGFITSNSCRIFLPDEATWPNGSNCGPSVSGLYKKA